MPTYQFANNASSTLAAGVDDTETTLQLQPGDGPRFPTPNATTGELFHVTLQDDTGAIEVCQCTSVSGDNLIVVRQQENTVAQSWSATTTRVELRLTQAVMDSLVQKEIAWRSAGSGFQWNDSTGALATSLTTADAAGPFTQLLGATASVSLKSLVSLDFNDVTFPLATAVRAEGDVPELDASANKLVWTPRGARILDSVGAPQPRRPDLQFVGATITSTATANVVETILASVGEIKELAYAVDIADFPGWLECGQAVDRTTYAALFARLGTTWGPGNGSTTFDLPPNGRVTISADGGTYTVGDTPGTAEVTLTIDQIPSHQHSYSRRVTEVVGNPGGTVAAGDGLQTVQTGSTGNGQPHNNIQPSMVVSRIIYAGV